MYRTSKKTTLPGKPMVWSGTGVPEQQEQTNKETNT